MTYLTPLYSLTVLHSVADKLDAEFEQLRKSVLDLGSPRKTRMEAVPAVKALVEASVQRIPGQLSALTENRLAAALLRKVAFDEEAKLGLPAIRAMIRDFDVEIAVYTDLLELNQGLLRATHEQIYIELGERTVKEQEQFYAQPIWVYGLTDEQVATLNTHLSWLHTCKSSHEVKLQTILAKQEVAVRIPTQALAVLLGGVGLESAPETKGEPAAEVEAEALNQPARGQVDLATPAPVLA